MPAAHALEIERETEILISDEIAEPFFEALAVVARSRCRHEIVEEGLRMRSRNHGIDARELTEAQSGCRPFPRDAADRRAWPEVVADIELTCGLPDLEPDIAGEGFVRTFAGNHCLESLRVHLARECKERRARGVEHRAFRRADQ